MRLLNQFSFRLYDIISLMLAVTFTFNSLLPVTKIAEFANSVDLDEVAHYEPPHLDLHCLPSSL